MGRGRPGLGLFAPWPGLLCQTRGSAGSTTPAQALTKAPHADFASPPVGPFPTRLDRNRSTSQLNGRRENSRVHNNPSAQSVPALPTAGKDGGGS